MPQRGQTDPDGWILSEQLEFKPQELKPEEIEPFLESLLTDIARRPAKIQLRETASVVRFLRRLLLQGVPSEGLDAGPEAVTQYVGDESLESRQARNRLDQMAQVIWNVLLQNGALPTSDKDTAVTFLKHHRSTYLAHFDVEETIKLIETLRLPEDSEDPFPPPHLISQTMTSTGEGNPNLSSDLTEKIYVAYQVLKRHQIKGAQGRLAETLTRLNVERERGGTRWTYAEINDKVKQYKRRLREQVGPSTDEATEEAISRRTDYLINRQIASFHGRRDLEKYQKELQKAREKAAKKLSESG